MRSFSHLGCLHVAALALCASLLFAAESLGDSVTVCLSPYQDAVEAFSKAKELPEGPDRKKAMRKAAALYHAQLVEDPTREAAPEVAFNAAFGYKEAGDYPQAISVYELFAREYGKEEILLKLEKGDATSTPLRPADPRRYKERLHYLRQGLTLLERAYLMLFSPAEAALIRLADMADPGSAAGVRASEVVWRRREQWRTARDGMLSGTDKQMVTLYVEAILWDKAWKTGSPTIDSAIRRLVLFTDILGDTKLRELSRGVVTPDEKKPFEYKDGMFLRNRRGLGFPLPPRGVASPLPAGAR